MSIFNWAQDNNIIWIENIDWWLLNHFKKFYRILRGGNGLSQKRAENVCRKMFNDIGITPMDRLDRLIGFGDDGEDFYYIVKDQNGRIVWNSMVGTFCTLKGKISNWDYHNIESSMNMNGCPREKEFSIKIEIRNE